MREKCMEIRNGPSRCVFRQDLLPGEGSLINILLFFSLLFFCVLQCVLVSSLGEAETAIKLHKPPELDDIRPRTSFDCRTNAWGQFVIMWSYSRIALSDASRSGNCCSRSRRTPRERGTARVTRVILDALDGFTVAPGQL